MTPPDVIAGLRALAHGEALLEALDGERGVHLVGGAVRDLYRGVTPLDLDLVVEGDAIAVARRLAERLGGSVTDHDRFGTASVALLGLPLDVAGAVALPGLRLDVAGARAESYPRPGALPDVRPATLSEDLARRDFTMHAVAVALGPPEPGRTLAVAHALEDLAAGRLRVLHDESFRDDPTRLLRLTRYGARGGFAAEPHTAALAAAAVREGALDTLTGPRAGAELLLAAAEPDPLAALAALAPLGIDRAIDPGLRLDRALAERALALLGGEGDRGAVALACLVRGAGEGAGDLLTRLGFSAPEQRVPRALAGPLPALARELAGAPGAAAIVTTLSGRSPAEVALVGALGAEAAATRWLGELRHVRLAIDGDDLLAAGVREGPAVGHALRAALAAKVEGVVDSPAAELAAAVAAAAEFEAGAE